MPVSPPKHVVCQRKRVNEEARTQAVQLSEHVEVEVRVVANDCRPFQHVSKPVTKFRDGCSDVSTKLGSSVWPTDRQAVNVKPRVMHIFGDRQILQTELGVVVGFDVEAKHVHDGNPAFPSTSFAEPAMGSRSLGCVAAGSGGCSTSPPSVVGLGGKASLTDSLPLSPFPAMNRMPQRRP